MNELIDVFSNLGSSSDTITPAMMLLALLAAFIGGQVIAWTYMWSHSGISYSRGYVQSLVLISIVVALVMIVVGTNIFIAFGLFGAFAIIRFRNVLKDTRDTAFIFMELAVGLAAGTWNFQALVVGVAVFTVVSLYLSKSRFGSLDTTDALAHLRAPAGIRKEVEKTLSLFCVKTRLISHHADSAGKDVDWSWRVLLRDPDRIDEMIETLTTLEGVDDVSIQYQGETVEA